jgi:hypothetical protein
MPKRIFDSATWRKIGQPDLNSRMYFIQGGRKVWGNVTSIAFTRKGIELQIKIK